MALALEFGRCEIAPLAEGYCTPTIFKQAATTVCVNTPEPSPRFYLLVILGLFQPLLLLFQCLQQHFQPKSRLPFLTRHSQGVLAIQQDATSACTPEPLLPASLVVNLNLPQSSLPLLQRQQQPSQPESQPSPLRRSQRALAKRKIRYSSSGRCGCKDNCGSDECMNRGMLVECNYDNCDYGLSRCQNRPFSNPPQRKLTLFDTGTRRGRGLRTDVDLPQGVFVAELKGRVRSTWDSVGINSRSRFRMALSGGRELDAQHVNTKARYINHSCEPNCQVGEWDGADGKQHVAVFTVVPVAAGTELTFPYHHCTKSRASQEEKNDECEECLCGTDKCCGRLWGS